MHRKQQCGGVSGWTPVFFFLLLVAGIGTSRAQPGRGPALVLRGIAQYEDSALFRPSIASLEEALKCDIDYRDSTRACFYLSFSHFKLGHQDEGNRYFIRILRRDGSAKLPPRTEEFADRFERIRQQVKEQPDAPAEEPVPPSAETLPTPGSGPSSESAHVKVPAYVQPQFANYVAGASAGAVLGLASYFTSVLFDNKAADNLKAFTLTADPAVAQEFKAKASQYQSLGDVFYYSSYPLIAVGFYLGFKVSERALAGRVAFMEDGSPTRVCCSLDKDLHLSLGVRRSIW